MIKYITSSVAFDTDRKMFVDVSKRTDIGGKWWDVFNYPPYRIEYKMSTGREMNYSESFANSLPLPFDGVETIETMEAKASIPVNEPFPLARGVNNDNIENRDTQVTTGAGSIGNRDEGNGPIDILQNPVMGIPIWVWVIGVGTLIYSWKPKFLTEIFE